MAEGLWDTKCVTDSLTNLQMAVELLSQLKIFHHIAQCKS